MDSIGLGPDCRTHTEADEAVCISTYSHTRTLMGAILWRHIADSVRAMLELHPPFYGRGTA